MRHWLSMRDWSLDELDQLVEAARLIKSGRGTDLTNRLRGRIVGLMFFNPSLRTRVSFEAAMMRFGGHAISLNVGGDAWKLEHRDGTRMDGDRAEHIREAAPVLSRYCDVLGVRTFAGLNDIAEDAADVVIRAFCRHATVPVVNMESAFEHPCQGLADRMVMEEKLGRLRGAHFVLTWAPHVKGLPMAVPHSAVLAAASAGMKVTVAHPPGYDLHPDLLLHAKSRCDQLGSSLTITHDQSHACATADAVYTKSWGAPLYYGSADAQAASFREHANWMVTSRLVGKPGAVIMHCLPVRRNVVMADDALNDRRCIVVDQAENRLWVQAAILSRLLAAREPVVVP